MTKKKMTPLPIERRAEEMRQRLEDFAVVAITVTYDGYADSFSIEHVGTSTADNKPVVLPSQLESELIDLFYDLLEVRFNGWEDHSGSFGEFTWDLRTNDIRHTHNSRFEYYDTTVQDGWSVPEPEKA
jgi:hypothetical protein